MACHRRHRHNTCRVCTHLVINIFMNLFIPQSSQLCAFIKCIPLYYGNTATPSTVDHAWKGTLRGNVIRKRRRSNYFYLPHSRKYTAFFAPPQKRMYKYEKLIRAKRETETRIKIGWGGQNRGFPTHFIKPATNIVKYFYTHTTNRFGILFPWTMLLETNEFSQLWNLNYKKETSCTSR